MPYKKRKRHQSVCSLCLSVSLSAMWGNNKTVTIQKPGRETSPEIWIGRNHDLTLLASRTVRKLISAIHSMVFCFGSLSWLTLWGCEACHGVCHLLTSYPNSMVEFLAQVLRRVIGTWWSNYTHLENETNKQTKTPEQKQFCFMV